MPLSRLSAVAFIALTLQSGCIEQTGPGPDLGPCAVSREGIHTYGEVGIGTCLSGPTDMAFIERDGQTWLAVTNADPFINFDGGSVLLLDWDDVTGRFDDDEVVLTADVVAETLPTERFIAGVAQVQDSDKNVLMVTRRLSEDARTRSNDDSAYLFDLDEMSPYQDGQIDLKDDPADVVVDSNGRAFVLNFTDHSVSVVDTTDATIHPIDLAPDAAIVPAPFVDTDGSGSVAEFGSVALGDPTRVPSDQWDLTWLPGQYRVWAPEGAGMQRWESGGLSPQPAGLDGSFSPGLEDLDQVNDAFLLPVQLDRISDATPFLIDTPANFELTMLYAFEGAIYREFTVSLDSPDGLVTQWRTDPIPLLGEGPAGEFDEFRAGPAMSIADGNIALYFDASETEEDREASISMATSLDAFNYSTFDAPILEPDGAEITSLEQPFVQVDARMNKSRMWMSVYRFGRYEIGYSESEDGLTWSPVTTVADFAFGDLAAPVVRYVDGTYVMWATRSAGAEWEHVMFRSADGLDWGEPELLFVSDQPYDPRKPPRLAGTFDPASSWRVEGIDNGRNARSATAGVRYFDFTHGYEFMVASGHEFSTEIFPVGMADGGVEPGSHYDFGGIDWVYVTTFASDGRPRIHRMESVGDSWTLEDVDLIPTGEGGNEQGVTNPVVFAEGGSFAMIYSAIDDNGVSTLQGATSTDASEWLPTGPLFAENALEEWASVAAQASSVERTDDGLRIWISGSNGSRFRIGSIANDAFDPANPSAGWVLERGELDTPFQFTTGQPGSIDDSGVKDPVVMVDAEGTTVMYYSGFDGSRWHLGHATRREDGTWARRIDETTEETLSAMSPIARTFAAGSIDRPVARLRGDGAFEMWYAGRDLGVAGTPRIGKAVGRGPHVFPQLRQPTVGDTMSFETQRGDEDGIVSVIELAQSVDAFSTTGVGTTSLILDEERGFLYVPSKLTNLLYVVDIRDDSSSTFVDRNAMDLETLIRLPTLAGSNGFRGGVISENRDVLYLTTRNPESIALIDLGDIVDDADKEVTDLPTFGTLGMQDSFTDAGANSVASIGGGQPALTTGGTGELLIVPHFRDNSVSIYDLGLGAFGAEIAYLPWVGENPHQVVVSPDGRYGVVANYLGDIIDEQSSSTLAILDLDPASPTYLTVTNWIKNR